MKELLQYLRFIQEAETLKSVTRTAWTASGRRESTAEHTWRLTLFTALMADFYPGLDREKLLMLSLLHDLGELYGGDKSAHDLPDPAEKQAEERAAVLKLFALLPERKGAEYLALWEEYDAAQTPEAKLMKALDKAETILQHNQGANPPDFDYPFNLTYGKAYFENDPILLELRKYLDADTADHIQNPADTL